MLYPPYYILSFSFSGKAALIKGISYLYPAGFNIIAYRYILLSNETPMAYINSVFYSFTDSINYYSQQFISTEHKHIQYICNVDML